MDALRKSSKENGKQSPDDETRSDSVQTHYCRVVNYRWQAQFAMRLSIANLCKAQAADRFRANVQANVQANVRANGPRLIYNKN